MNEKQIDNYNKMITLLYEDNQAKYHILYTTEGYKFKIIKSKLNNIVVIPFTDKATSMTISKEEIDKTLEKKGNYKSYSPIILEYLNGDKDFYEIEIENNNTIQLNNPTTKLKYISIKNIILFGSPGVGKTHNTNKLISLIEEGKTQKEIFDTISQNTKSDFTDISHIKDRVKFITFHQNFGYEDFIEGFRPNESGDIELVNGIFKNISIQASKNINKSFSLDKLIFDDAFELLLKEKIENSDVVRIDLNRENSYYEIYDYNEKSIYYTRQGRSSEERYHTLSILTLKLMYEAENCENITGGLKTYYRPLLKKLLSIGKENKLEKTKQKNYYIVIDEINRGHISKIFGELITLIEEDKREKYKVILPYSKQPFSIPPNLYIIGTMNSTDKSIALIDIAFRRRFVFLKMQPNKDLIIYESAKNIFVRLNKEIKDTLGEEYLIGHSYFMNISDKDELDFVLNYKIKPLLEEYYYGDERLDKILDILRR